MENRLIEIGQTLSSAINQLGFIAAIIGGFAIALVAGLMNSEKKRITNVTISILAATSLLQISCALFFSLVSFKILTLSANNKMNSLQELLGRVEISVSIGLFSMVFFISILLFIVSIALSGWIRSKQVGIFTTAVATASFLLSFYGLSML